MNINLSKLLKNETIPQIHEASLREQLKIHGTLQYTRYNDGGVHFNLLDCADNVDLEVIKQIILSHNYNAGKLIEDNAKVIEARVKRYEAEVDPLVIEAIRTNDNIMLAQANTIVTQIKQDLPKVV